MKKPCRVRRAAVATSDRFRRRPDRTNPWPRDWGRGKSFGAHAVGSRPVCSPYRASLLTGRYPLTQGVFVNAAVGRWEAFAAQGYDSACLGNRRVYGLGRSALAPAKTIRVSMRGRRSNASVTTTIPPAMPGILTENLSGLSVTRTLKRTTPSPLSGSVRKRGHVCLCFLGVRRTIPMPRRRRNIIRFARPRPCRDGPWRLATVAGTVRRDRVVSHGHCSAFDACPRTIARSPTCFEDKGMICSGACGPRISCAPSKPHVSRTRVSTGFLGSTEGDGICEKRKGIRGWLGLGPVMSRWIGKVGAPSERG